MNGALLVWAAFWCGIAGGVIGALLIAATGETKWEGIGWHFYEAHLGHRYKNIDPPCGDDNSWGERGPYA